MTNNEVKTAFLFGYSAHSLHLRTNGTILTSYSTDVAQRYRNITLVDCSPYSVTTAKHVRSINGICVPCVNNTDSTARRRANFGNWHEANIKYLTKEIERYELKIKNARKYDYTKDLELAKQNLYEYKKSV